jgi:hypothetical protein
LCEPPLLLDRLHALECARARDRPDVVDQIRSDHSNVALSDGGAGVRIVGEDLDEDLLIVS